MNAIKQGFTLMIIILMSFTNAYSDMTKLNFSSRVDYHTGEGPSQARAMAISDFNNDGFDDLAVTNDNATVSVLLGHADGTFRKEVLYSVEYLAVSIAISDLNNDGFQDIVTMNGATYTDYEQNISILLGNGDGTFQESTCYFLKNINDRVYSYEIGETDRSLAIGDINNDGYQDIIVSDWYIYSNPTEFSRGISIMFGNGDGTFQDAVHYHISNDMSGPPNSVAVSDLNGDGFQDVAITNAPDEVLVSILLGNGDGTFQDIISYTYDFSGNYVAGKSVAVSDLNNDGFQDLVVTGGRVYILLGNGNGTFVIHASYYGFYDSHTYMLGSNSIDVSDINGDEITDIAVTTTGDSVAVLTGNGDGTFQDDFICYDTGKNSESVVLSDFNHDGCEDIAVANKNSGNVSVLFGDEGCSFSNDNEHWGGTCAFPIAITISDFNSDGFQDLALAPDKAMGVYISYGNGDGTFQEDTEYYLESSPWLSFVTSSDLNDDSHQDLVAFSDVNDVFVLLGNGDGTFQNEVQYEIGNHAEDLGIRYPVPAAISDFNNDGFQDIIAPHWDLSGAYDYSWGLSIMLGNGDGTFQDTILLHVNDDVSSVPSSVAVSDLNGDGFQDVAVVNDNTSVLLGNGDGTFQDEVVYDTGYFSKSVAIADLNNDGHQDLAVTIMDGYTFRSSYISVLLGNGDGSFQGEVRYLTEGDNSISVSICDLNHDGNQDFVVANRYTDNISVLLGNGDGTFQDAVCYGAGVKPIAVAISDLNNDGNQDLAAINYSHHTVSIFINNYSVVVAPDVLIDPPSAITSSSATLSGELHPNGLTSWYYFEYGITTDYGWSTSTVNAGAGLSAIPVDAQITNLEPNTVYYCRLVASNSEVTQKSVHRTFTTLSSGSPPSVVTNAADSFTSSAATLNGSVDPNGLSTTYYFEYGTTTGYGSTTSTVSAGSGTNAVDVDAGISSLSASTTYHFRLVATNSMGTTYGADRTLTTLSSGSPPSVVTNAADSFTSSAATLNGSVDPNGLSTTYYFEYGTTTGYGSTTSTVSAGSGTNAVDVDAGISSLSASTTYHFRLVATNSMGTTYGADRTLTTLSSGSPPSVVTNAADSFTSSAATLNGSVDPNGLSTTYYFEYGTTTGYGSTTSTVSAGSGTNAVDVDAGISSLSASTTYHFRLVATNSMGTTYGADRTFTTLYSGSNEDNDGDGYTENQGDCDDGDADIHPGATEICGDGIDQDCNGNDLACSGGDDDIIPDTTQENVTSIQAYGSNDTIILESPAGTTMEDCQASDNPSPGNTPADIDFPYGLFSFTIGGVTPGGSTTMTITLPAGANPTNYYKYGPTPDNPSNHWYLFMHDGETGAVISGNIITLHFVDGKRGDSDLATNGTIVDPGGPSTDIAVSTPSENTGGSDDGGGSGCFIGSLTQ